MGVTSYHTVGGQLLGETTSALVSRNYLTDALGSVTATTTGASIENTYRYKPYGDRLSKTGAGADPRFGWVGAKGYSIAGRKYYSHYVRARGYSDSIATWSSRDLYWPGEHAYVYAAANPTTYADPTGRATELYGCSKTFGDEFKKMCDKLNDCLKDSACTNRLLSCIGDVREGKIDVVREVLKRLGQACKPPQDDPKGPLTCIFCNPSGLPGCSGICDGRDGITPMPLTGKDGIFFGRTIRDSICKENVPPAGFSGDGLECAVNLRAQNKNCQTVSIVCDGDALTGMHELTHALGIAGQPRHNRQDLKRDFVERIEDCIKAIKL